MTLSGRYITDRFHPDKAIDVLDEAGSRVKLELAVNHRYEYFDAHVARTPLFNPERRTA